MQWKYVSGVTCTAYIFVTLASSFISPLGEIHMYNGPWSDPFTTTSSNGNIIRVTGLCEGNPPVTGGFPHKGQWRGALIFSLIYAWTNGWANNRDADDLWRHRAHYDVIVMFHPALVHSVIQSLQKQTSRGLMFSQIEVNDIDYICIYLEFYDNNIIFAWNIYLYGLII